MKLICLYSRISMAQTSLEPSKYIRDKGSLSERVLLIAPGQEA